MIGVGVIGYGYWGPNLVRNFSRRAGCRVVAVSDCVPEPAGPRGGALSRRSRRPPTIASCCAIRAIDAVVIATPVSTHFELALQALRAGKHVWSRSR